MELQYLIDRAESCHREIALEYYDAFSGRKDRLEAAAIYGRYPELFARETLDQINALPADNGTDERERRCLRRVFTLNYISDRLKGLKEELANAEGEAQLRCDGEDIPFRSAPIVIGAERDYAKRELLDMAYLEVLASFNPLRQRIHAEQGRTLSELGYSGVIDLCERVKGQRIYLMREMMARFLDDTEQLYPPRLEEQSRAAGLALADLRHADIGFMLSAPQYDRLFPADDLVGALARTLAGLGIDLYAQDNVTLDLESRPKKSPRAFCIGIEPPRDVRLVLKPRGGQDDYSTLLHEAGHLEFGAHMAPELSFLYRQHGDTSVHEGYAFLLQHLVEDPLWWEVIMGIKPDGGSAIEERRLADGFIRFARFHRLYFLRRYGAKLNYEVEFHELGGGPQLAENYARWLSRGVAIPYPRERYLQDFDDNFYVLEYLQAWIWEVQLRNHLKRQFGEAWFMNPLAGDFLRGLWREGMKYDVWELATQLGYGGLDIAPLQAELTG